MMRTVLEALRVSLEALVLAAADVSIVRSGLKEASHKPLYVDAECPLCHETGADYYAGHKGLLVCQSCGKTFDPSVE